MKNLSLALLLSLTVTIGVLPVASMAAPKHGRGTHAATQQPAPPAADTAKPEEDVAPAEPVVPVAPPPAWKAAVGTAVVKMGGSKSAAKLGVEPATLGLLSAATMILLLLVALTALLWRRRKKGDLIVYAGDYLNSIMVKHSGRSKSRSGDKKPKVPKVLPKAKPVSDLPVGFDLPTFLAKADGYFLLVQDAWDRGDVEDMREFTSDDMLFAFELQIVKRKKLPYETSIEQLESALIRLDCSGDYLATVQFSGMVKEENNPAKEFLELWYLQKQSSYADKWLLVGIRQLA